MLDTRIELILRQLGQAFNERAWHGTNLAGSLRGVGPALAVWRPRPGGNNIAELVLHAAYWKYRVRRAISTAPPRSFDLKGTNFFPRVDVPTPRDWKSDIRLLEVWHGRLIIAVEAFDPDRLSATVGGKGFTYSDLITGVAAHDVYHTGQIQLIKRLHRSA